ncbi:MAG: hypothetical protein WC971_04020 [Coriobacteriia bacterium]
MMYGRGFDYGYGNMMGGWWLGGLLMMVFGALVVAGIVLLIIWAVRAASGHGAHPGAAHPSAASIKHDEAVAIARRRLASGEIAKDQYDELLRALGG